MGIETVAGVLQRRVLKENQASAEGGLNGQSGSEYLDPHSPEGRLCINLVHWIKRSSNLSEGNLLNIGMGTDHLDYWMSRMYPKLKLTQAAPLIGAVEQENVNSHPEASVVYPDVSSSPSDAFEGVTLIDTLQHLDPESVETVLREAYRVLKDQGMIFVSVPNLDAYNRQALDTPTNIWVPSVPDMQYILGLVGFQNIHVTTRGFPTTRAFQEMTGRDLHLPLFGSTIHISGQK